jgi:hypothetical protein
VVVDLEGDAMNGLVCLLIEPDFKPGDPPPSGYNNWHAWARVQDRAGLKQRRCWKCGLWRFPQEACCGLEPPDLHHAAFTVDDVLSGKAPWPAGIPRKRKATKW